MKKLNLGCGEDYREGFINIDFNSHLKVDIQYDLNQFPYPFEDNEFDYILASHIIEHLDKAFIVMKELRRISKPGGKIHIKVPHFSRGFTHAEHKSGFDISFPYYFNANFTKSGYFGVSLNLIKMRLHYFAFFDLLKYLGVGKVTIFFMKGLNIIISFLANLSPTICSRVWCFWVGGFDEIEFLFEKP